MAVIIDRIRYALEYNWSFYALATKSRNFALSTTPPTAWYYFPIFFDHYRKLEYEAAFAAAQKIDMPDFFWAHAVRVAAYGQLDRTADAQLSIKRMLELDPDIEATAREKRLKVFQYQEPLLDQFMDGLRKAGMKIPDNKK